MFEVGSLYRVTDFGRLPDAEINEPYIVMVVHCEGPIVDDYYWCYCLLKTKELKSFNLNPTIDIIEKL